MSAPTAFSGYDIAARSCSRSSTGQGPEHVVHDVFGQVRREVGELVGIELLGRGDAAPPDPCAR